MSALTTENVSSDPVAFPLFEDHDLQKVVAFGKERQFREGETLVKAGTRHYDCHFILSGKVRVVDISSDEESEVVVHSRGQFIGDLDLLTGRPGVVDIIAIDEVTTACLKSDQIRDFLVTHPQIGDRMLAAFLKRRKLLGQTGFEGIRIYGHKDCSATMQIQEFWYRNGVPHTWKNIEIPEEKKRLDDLGIACDALPLLTYGSREILRKPSLQELATHLGIQRETDDRIYDTLIIGSGPSGLGAAVYAASEGLSTLVIDNIGPGGQAGSSSKIENYAGFPTGLSGRELALRSYLQALKFGAEFLAPCAAHTIVPLDDGSYGVELCTGSTVTAKTVVIATGINYRQLKVEGMEQLRGSGIFYNATQVEAILCRKKPVHIIGAGNSAGQAAMFLSTFASKVNLLVRGTDISKSMSEYLWTRVEKNPKIDIRYQAEMTALQGEDSITAIRVKDQKNGSEDWEDTTGIFIFIGGVPCTDFLPEGIARDANGFVLAGAQLADHPSWEAERAPCALETSYPGVFVSGDCRAGTTKRVAFAIGDGALAVTCIHEHLGTYR